MFSDFSTLNYSLFSAIHFGAITCQSNPYGGGIRRKKEIISSRTVNISYKFDKIVWYSDTFCRL